MHELPELNPVVHGKLRLAILSLLSGAGEAEFTWLRTKTGSTDGNLGAQLAKLEEAGYVAVEKQFVMRKPQTLYRMTEAGHGALAEYVAALKQLLGAAVIGDRVVANSPAVPAWIRMSVIS
jgi:DNA-binding HxlR family transcriptional regulator